MPLAVKNESLLIQNGGLKECCCEDCFSKPCGGTKPTLTLQIHSISPSSITEQCFSATVDFSPLVGTYVLNYNPASTTQFGINTYSYSGPCAIPGETSFFCVRTNMSVFGPRNNFPSPPLCLSNVGLDFAAGIAVAYNVGFGFPPFRTGRLQLRQRPGLPQAAGANGFNACTLAPVYTRDVHRSINGTVVDNNLDMQFVYSCGGFGTVFINDIVMTASITI